MDNKFRYIPLLMTVCVVVGILIGSFYSSRFSTHGLSIISSSGSKIGDLLHIIEEKYVDEVDPDSLTEKTIPLLLQVLDPHSSYSNAAQVKADMESLEGGFSGIGVMFRIIDDTIMVISTVAGGPAAEVGVVAGDRIVTVDDKPFCGDLLTEEIALKTLKGEEGTQVKLGLYRNGQLVNLTVTRGDIPIKSIEAAYIIEDKKTGAKTGVIDLRLFGETTYGELLAELAELSHLGMERLIIDLRENHGGYMEPAIKMANEFLPQGCMVVYTEGRRSKRASYVSDGRGSYQTLPLVVLVSEETASASEIFAAAMQDNDRAMVVGRRTFGKGLVQEPIRFNDGSMLRLTIARYYTASGRCLQKPYAEGEIDAYAEDLIHRWEHGEAFSSDSIHLTGKTYKTRLGRTVYGGGGVMPDYFVPADTAGATSYFQEAVLSGLLQQWAFRYSDVNRAKLKGKTMPELASYLEKQDLPEKFAEYGEKHGLKRRNIGLHKSYSLFKQTLSAFIIDYTIDEEARIQYLNQEDATVLKALEILAAGKSFPSLPDEKKDGNKNESESREATAA